MVYFLSDAHLGSRAIDNPEVHQQTLIDMLNGMAKDATAIYLLGDIFDFWCEYFWRDRSKEQYRPFLQTLRAITDKGIAVHFFIGNHDIWTFGWLAKETGVQVHRKPESILLNGKRFFLAHGDGLVPSNYLQQLPQKVQKKIRQFIFLRAVFHNPILQFLFRLLPPAWANAFGYEWAKNSRLKELARPCPYKGEDKEIALPLTDVLVEEALGGAVTAQREENGCTVLPASHRRYLSTAASAMAIADAFRAAKIL